MSARIAATDEPELWSLWEGSKRASDDEPELWSFSGPQMASLRPQLPSKLLGVIELP